MEIQQLKCVIEVARCQSISEAAEKLHTNQSLLSNIINELETEIGISIFSRSSRGVMTTEKGKKFILHAQTLLEDFEKLERNYKGENYTKAFKYTVTVPISCYIAQAFVEFAKELADNAPVQINYCETNSMAAIQRVSEHNSNIAIVRYLENNEDYYLHYIERKDLIAMPLWRFKYQLVFSQGSPLAQKENIELSDLEGLTEISHGDPSVFVSPISEPVKMKRGEVGHQEIVVYDRQSQLELLCQLSQTYLWASPTPQCVLERYPLIQKQCDSLGQHCKDVLIYRKEYCLNPVDQLFIQKVKREIVALESSKTC